MHVVYAYSFSRFSHIHTHAHAHVPSHALTYTPSLSLFLLVCPYHFVRRLDIGRPRSTAILRGIVVLGIMIDPINDKVKNQPQRQLDELNCLQCLFVTCSFTLSVGQQQIVGDQHDTRVIRRIIGCRAILGRNSVKHCARFGPSADHLRLFLSLVRTDDKSRKCSVQIHR